MPLDPGSSFMITANHLAPKSRPTIAQANTIQIAGHIRSSLSNFGSSIASPADGKITALHVQVGASVQNGQLVAEVGA